jgi:F-type H+-transporting ATPase subunit a
MSALADKPTTDPNHPRVATPDPAEAPEPTRSRGKQIGLGLGVLWIAGVIFFIAVYGFKPHKATDVANNSFSAIGEFRLDTWFSVGPVDFNKGILYVVLAAAITLALMFYVAHRLKQRPQRLQTAIEMFYGLTSGMAGDNIASERLGRKYFPLIATLFIFILVSNLIGYIPLPVNSVDKFTIFGAHLPSFQIYAADTNVAFPLVLSLIVFALFSFERLKYNHYNPIAFIKSLIPSGVPGPLLPLIYIIEMLSYFLRLVSLTVRLWANLLAGHLLIAFMSGELGVLTGDTWVEWLLFPAGIAIFAFEAVLIAGLQAYIFSILTAIYVGDAVTDH